MLKIQPSKAIDSIPAAFIKQTKQDTFIPYTLNNGRALDNKRSSHRQKKNAMTKIE